MANAKTDQKLPVSIPHNELAMQYFTDKTKASAAQQLTRWVRADKALMQQLLATGYRPSQHYYIPKQVLVIYEHLGRPVDISNED